MIGEEDSIPVVEDSIRVVEDKSEETKEEFIDQTSVIEHLEKKTDNSSQFFIVIRRKVPFQRVLSLWQRATKKSSPTQRLTVKYVGEDGIDTGALAREFLTDCMDNMRSATASAKPGSERIGTDRNGLTKPGSERIDKTRIGLTKPGLN